MVISSEEFMVIALLVPPTGFALTIETLHPFSDPLVSAAAEEPQVVGEEVNVVCTDGCSPYDCGGAPCAKNADIGGEHRLNSMSRLSLEWMDDRRSLLWNHLLHGRLYCSIP